MAELTHLDKQNHPRMVTVADKNISLREAEAEALVLFPQEAWDVLRAAGFATQKGAIADVARVAGTMAVKQTAQWIPFCHTLPVEGCRIAIEPVEGRPALSVRCTVVTTARTGVEMEALTGASAAALTLYDMTKSLGHGIEISRVRLLKKTGGKKDYTATDS